MKKILLIAVAILALSCNQQPKTAFVDVEEILKEYKGMKDAQKEMDKKQSELKSGLDKIAADYQAKVRDYYAKAQKMSNKQRQQTEQLLQQEQQALGQRQQAAQAEVQKYGQEKMEEINEDVVDFVADYAKKNGYSYIFGTSEQTKTVLYGDAKSDLTDTILDALNNSYKKGDTKVEETKKDTVK